MRIRWLIIIGIILTVVLGVNLIVSNSKDNSVVVKKDVVINKEVVPQENTAENEILKQAIYQKQEENLIEAKLLYDKLVTEFSNSPSVTNWQNEIWDINMKLIVSSTVGPGSELYEIQQGDSLDKIAKKFNTTVSLLKESNNLSNDVIIAGRSLKVWTKPFNIVVDKSQNILILKSNDEVVKIYTVSTGVDNSTPVGSFKVVNKLVNPSWFKAGAIVPAESPDNILGSRWLGIDSPGYGIHGTTEPEHLGKQITQGCVRMANSDVEELFALVPVGTEVVIVN